MATDWRQDLTRRLRTLLRARPLVALEANKAMRGLALDDQDLLGLALRTLDVVIEAMGLRHGASHREVADALEPLVRAADADLPGEAVAAVVDVVVDGLTNREHRGEAFAVPYTDFREGVVRRELRFHLLREVEDDEGDVVLRATTEGINLYAGMLDYDVEDAQTAEEAVLQAQVARGRLGEAVETARRARHRSIQFEEKMRSFLRSARRDVRGVDWAGEVLGVIHDALDHLEERVRFERRLRRQIDARLADADDLGPLVELADALDDCLTRHLRLQRHLTGANDAWLAEQERQVFRPRAAMPLPDLERQVLLAALAMPVGAADRAVPTWMATLHAPDPPRVVGLDQLVGRLLAPRRRIGIAAPEDRVVELEALVVQPRFSDDDRAAVHALLEGVDDLPLSELLARARAEAYPPAVGRLLALTVLKCFESGLELRVARDGQELVDPAFAGDDLRVTA